MNYGFIIDNRKCIGCHACTVACKAEHNVPIGVNRTWVKYVEKGEFPNTRRLFSVMRCNHCADAPCVDICPTAALHTRSDGIVDFDNRRCIACKACLQACPYDALFIDPESKTAAKCNYCAHRIEVGLEPSCVIVCPEHAIISGDLDNPQAEISQLLAREQVTARKVEKGTQPKLFYIEGDEISLHPDLTAQSDAYMWSSQSGGVGHFAHFAENKAAAANQEEMLQQLSDGGEGAKWLAPEDHNDAVLVPAGPPERNLIEKARDVLKENVRRVYDAPAEGPLWNWKVAAYVWTKAISAGAFLTLFLALKGANFIPSPELQWTALGLGTLFLLLTTVFLVIDLDQPARFFYVLLRPNWSSWLVRGGYAITFYGLFLGISALDLLSDGSLHDAVLWPTCGSAIMTAIYTAFLFAQAKGRDFWQSPVLLLHMFVHAIVAGAAALSLVTFITGETAATSFFATTLLLNLLLNAVVIVAELLTPHATSDARRTVELILSGTFARLFWTGGIAVGTVSPALMLWLGTGGWIAAGASLALLGLYCIEYIWVRAPQEIPLS